MKLSRAVAIALLLVAGCASSRPIDSSGRWLLLVPQIDADGRADTSKPLSKWETVESFGTQNDCNYSLTRQKFWVHGAFGPIGSAQSAYQAQALQTLKAQCVASSDPRLRAQ